MTGNDSSDVGQLYHNGTNSNDDFERQYSYEAGLKEFNQNLVTTVLIIVLVLSLAALIYGVISWCVIEKFRHYRNYVCLNMIFVNFLLDSLYLKNDFIPEKIMYVLFIFLGTVKHYWLLVISHMFYVEIVKVFNTDTRRKYLKNSLFAWGLPLIPVIICLFMYFLDFDNELSFTIFIVTALISVLPLVANFIIYIIVLVHIFRSCCMRVQTAMKTSRRLFIATLIFILTDSLLLLRYFIQILYMIKGPFNEIVQILLTLLFYSNTILIDVFIVCVKSNRVMWSKYRARNQRSKKQEMSMRRIGDAPTV